jgi:GH15 family glucan-1,4-alpha-glucosidase
VDETPCAGQAYPAIADYALVGNCHTAALISRWGSVDWYCPGRFDAPAVFCRLLDRRRGGYLALAPAGHFAAERRYRSDTNVLETVFTADGGRVRLTDFMPIYRRTASRVGADVGTSAHLLRLVEGLGGTVEMDLRFRPTFDYARRAARVQVTEDGAVAEVEDGSRYLTLACPGVALTVDDAGGVHGHVRVAAGQRLWVALAHTADAPSARAALTLPDCDAALAETLTYWEDWAAACTYAGPYRSAVLRSALVLKLLTYEPSGAIVAAPTTSLPEQVGGVRNWDYRYTWLRDGALILYALMTVGYGAEADDFFHWLHRSCRRGRTTRPRIMYAVDTRLVPRETTLDHLEGYRGSRPVRLGNAASRQRQLDIYGEVLLAAHLHFERRPAPEEEERPGDGARLTPDNWALARTFVERAADHWQEPDRGIWEVRGETRDFLYSKLMCWAAVDRGIRLAEDWRLEAPLGHWRRTRDAIRQAILDRGFDAARGAFTQAFGSAALDASALIIPRIGFLPGTDPRVRSTIAAIQEQLTRDGLADRYHAPDGLPGSEASFALCSFWLVDALALGGQLDAAQALFERLVGYANDVGLLSEEVAAESGTLLGNFPQGFTHLALVRAAVNLAKIAKHGPEHHAETEAQRAGAARRAAAAG